MKTHLLHKLLRNTLLFLFLSSFCAVSAANPRPIISIVPQNPTLDEPISVIYDASQGNKALIWYNGKMYAHTGLTTNNGDWQYGTNWDTGRDAKHQLKSIGDNKWRLDMPEGIRKFYNIVSADEVVYKLFFVFRGEGTEEGKEADDSDIMLSLRQGYQTTPRTITNLNQPLEIIFEPNYFNLDFGNQDVYVHTGLITTLSSSNSDWQHGTNWGDNNVKYKLERRGKQYILNLANGISSFYGLGGSNELVSKLAFVVRNAAGDKQSENIFINVENPLIQTSVPFPSENRPFDILFNLSAGNKALANTQDAVYIHTGVITDKSNSNSDWKYGTDWDTPLDKHKLTKLNNDFYKITINSIRDFYAVSADDKVKNLIFVLRNLAGDKVGKTAQDGDILLPIYPSDKINLKIESPTSEKLVVKRGEKITFRAITSALTDISFSVSLNPDKDYIANNKNVLERTIDFNTSGTYTVSIKAGEYTKTIAIEVLESTVTEKLPKDVRPGINYSAEDNTKATLVLQAPYKNNVYVIGDFNDWKYTPSHQMKQDGEMFWLELNNLTPNEEYAFQYVIDGNVTIADPYTDKVLDEWNDKYINQNYQIYPNLKQFPAKASGIVSVLQTGQEAFQWQVENFSRPSRDNLMIYELHLRDFTTEGSYQSALKKLPYLKELGITAIELMPINEFEGNDSWGYNPSFYFAVDKAYGTKNDLKFFIDECHKEGIAVIIDMVLNHSFGQSPLFQMYKDSDGKPSLNNPWYNKDSNFGNPAAQWGVDFNHESAYTRAFVDSVNHYWLKEYKVDGIRFDFTKGFSNTPFPDEWGPDKDDARVYNIKRMNDKIKAVVPDAYVMIEHMSKHNVDDEIPLSAAGIMLWRKMTPQYEQAAMGWKEHSAFNQIYDWDRDVQMPTNSLVGFMESHDEERITFKAKDSGNGKIKTDLSVRMKQHATCAAFFLTVPGPKMIWQFGELGYDFSIDYNGRTGRKPIKWEYYEDEDRKGLYDTYAKLLNLRKYYPQLFNTRDPEAFQWYVSEDDWDKGRKLIVRASDGKQMVIVGNFTGADKNYTDFYFPSNGKWYEYITNSPYTVENNKGEVDVPANDFKLFINFEVPTKDIYTSDLRKTTLADNYKQVDNLRMRAGGWKDAKVSDFNLFLNNRSAELTKTTLDMRLAEIDPTAINGLFKDSRSLTSVILPQGDFSATEMFNAKTNPNRLIYTSNNTLVNATWKNVIKDGLAQTDVEIGDNNLFHFAQNFEVPTGKNIRYTRAMKSASRAGGWYTIALPFEPTNIESNALPGKNMNSITKEQSGDFWLRKYTGSGVDVLVGFDDVAHLEKNKPYIIAFPGKDWGANFPDEWTITFSSTSGAYFDNAVKIVETDNAAKYNFRGTLQAIDNKETLKNLYTLNFEENLFKKGESNGVKPFYGYFEDISSLTLRNMSLKIASKEAVENIVVPDKENLLKIYGSAGEVVVDTPSKIDVVVYNLSGRLITQRSLAEGKHAISLLPGIYIVNNNKVVVE